MVSLKLADNAFTSTLRQSRHDLILDRFVNQMSRWRHWLLTSFSKAGKLFCITGLNIILGIKKQYELPTVSVQKQLHCESVSIMGTLNLPCAGVCVFVSSMKCIKIFQRRDGYSQCSMIPCSFFTTVRAIHGPKNVFLTPLYSRRNHRSVLLSTNEGR